MIYQRHYVKFHSPGTFVSEISTKPIDSWDISKAIELFRSISERYGAKPYCFVFLTLEEMDSVVENGKEFEVNPNLVRKSGFYHLGGTLKYYHEIKAQNNKENDILLSNMSCNRKWIVVENNNSYRSVHYFEEDDFLVDLKNGSIVVTGKCSPIKKYRDKYNSLKDRNEI